MTSPQLVDGKCFWQFFWLFHFRVSSEYGQDVFDKKLFAILLIGCFVSECIKIVRMFYKIGREFLHIGLSFRFAALLPGRARDLQERGRMRNDTVHWGSRTYRNLKTEFPHIGSLQNRPLAPFAPCRLFSQISQYNFSLDVDLVFSKIGKIC